jgi:hypothetical protein
VPTHDATNDNDELDHLWPGHDVSEVRVRFTLNNDDEGIVDSLEVIDTEGRMLDMWKLTTEAKHWWESVLNSASGDDWERWREQQADEWDAECEARAMEHGRDR